MNITHRLLHRVADQIDRHGIATAEPAIATVIDRARHAGVSGIALAVLADPTQPEIARARAFGLVAHELARGSDHETASAPHRLLAAGQA